MTFDPDIELADTSVEGNIASDILAIKTAIELGLPKKMIKQMVEQSRQLLIELSRKQKNKPQR